jgi:trehalose 6-phosphate phosphatase
MERDLSSIWNKWPKLEEMLRDNDLILLCDYDGTLAPIAAHPALAGLPKRTRTALKLLAEKKQVRLGIVSGRPLREVRQLVRLKNVAYVGSHGYEMKLAGRRICALLSPQESQKLKTLARDLEKLLRDLPGIWIERKVAGVAVHYRQASPSAARRAVKLLQVIARSRAGTFRIQEGKMVFEFVPAGKVNKGSAVRVLSRQLRPSPRNFRIYLGDDLTDESAFSSLRARDFGVLVGKSRPSAAKYSLRSPTDVTKFLFELGGITR